MTFQTEYSHYIARHFLKKNSVVCYKFCLVLHRKKVLTFQVEYSQEMSRLIFYKIQEFRGRRHRTCWHKSHRSLNQNVVIK